MKQKAIKIIAEIARVIVGMVFVFSGFVKSIDPLGTAYKIGDYLHSFGLDVFRFLSLPASIGLSAIEMLIGLLLLVGIYRRFSTIIALAFILVMDAVTLYLAIANPISDCGCFGDALILTNWQTFWKNVFFTACIAFLFINHKRLTFMAAKKDAAFILFFCIAYPIGLSLYCYTRALPLIDFRPYKIGNTIEAGSRLQTNEPAFETIFIYEKDGIQQEFTIDNYPADNPEWTFVNAITTEIGNAAGHEGELFYLFNEQGDDVTEDILDSPDYTFLLISGKLQRASETRADLINDIHDYAIERKYNFYGVTASDDQTIEAWQINTGAEYPFLKADETLLKTVIRSNPGLLLLKESEIIYKWAALQIPDEQFFSRSLDEIDFEQMAKRKSRNRLIIAFTILFVPLGAAAIRKNTKEKNKLNNP